VDVSRLALVSVGGLVAGVANSVAGGGTLVSFPVLVAAGASPLSGNITSSVGLLTGYIGGTQAYRRELHGQGRRLVRLGATSLVGSAVGAIILLNTPASGFTKVAPFLIVLSCILLALSPQLAKAAAVRRQHVLLPRPCEGLDTQLPIFGAAIYGGYFGAGVGVMLLSVLVVRLIIE